MAQRFGGEWTQRKLNAIEAYLDSYTTALKYQPFKLIYVDAFAGEGQWLSKAEDDEFAEVRDGSARIALKVEDKPFDRLVFIELDPVRCAKLESLKSEYPSRTIEVHNGDANAVLLSICKDLQWSDRLVVFLDPFATSVDGSTVEALANTEKVDCWILFPLNAVLRLMPKDREPAQHEQELLDRVFGGRENWQSLYAPRLKPTFWNFDEQVRLAGSNPAADNYHNMLKGAFAGVASNRWILKNRRGAPLFALFFAASNPRGAARAVPIAESILLKALAED